jgi:hypothetical protein
MQIFHFEIFGIKKYNKYKKVQIHGFLLMLKQNLFS